MRTPDIPHLEALEPRMLLSVSVDISGAPEPPEVAYEGDTIALTANVTGADPDAVSYEWSVMPDGAPDGPGPASGPTFDFVPSDNGSYDVTVTVRVGGLLNGDFSSGLDHWAVGGAGVVDVSTGELRITVTNELVWDSELGSWSFADGPNSTVLSYVPTGTDGELPPEGAAGIAFDAAVTVTTALIEGTGPELAAEDYLLVELDQSDYGGGYNSAYLLDGASGTHTVPLSLLVPPAPVFLQLQTMPDGNLGDGGSSDATYEVTTEVVLDNFVWMVDGAGETATDTVTINVSNVAPTVTIATEPGTLYKYEVLDLEAAFADAGLADTHTAEIDWGDGTITPVSDLTGGAIAGSHDYEAYGTFTVTVRVTDDDGGEGIATLTVTVLDTESALNDLIQKIEDADLSTGAENSLTAKLAGAARLLGEDIENDRPIEALLDAFIRGVNHRQEKGEMTLETAAMLTSYAELIRLDVLDAQD
jgi:hypothetical protein